MVGLAVRRAEILLDECALARQRGVEAQADMKNSSCHLMASRAMMGVPFEHEQLQLRNLTNPA